MASEIIPNLWLGNILDSRNKTFMENIEVVINCSKNIPFYSKKAKNVRIKVDDDLQKEEIINMYQYLDNATELIHKYLLSNNTIFVHCYAGKQRSATIVCAYIMRYLNLSYKETTDLVRTKRLIIFTPLPNFDEALKHYDEKLKKK
jgi:protein-tyrosine phosphatase